MAKYNQRRDPSVVGAAEPPVIACAIAGDCPHHAAIQLLVLEPAAFTFFLPTLDANPDVGNHWNLARFWRFKHAPNCPIECLFLTSTHENVPRHFVWMGWKYLTALRRWVVWSSFWCDWSHPAKMFARRICRLHIEVVGIVVPGPLSCKKCQRKCRWQVCYHEQTSSWRARQSSCHAARCLCKNACWCLCAKCIQSSTKVTTCLMFQVLLCAPLPKHMGLCC